MLLPDVSGREDLLLRNIIQKYELEGTDLDVFYEEGVSTCRHILLMVVLTDEDDQLDKEAWADARDWYVLLPPGSLFRPG